MQLNQYLGKKYQDSIIIHRYLNDDIINGILSCGFLKKDYKKNTDINISLKYYGGLLLLRGTGKYIENDISIDLYPGCFIQRVPDKIHSTIVSDGEEWLEVFVCFGRELYFLLDKLGLIPGDKAVLFPGLSGDLIRTFTTFFDDLQAANDSQLPQLLIEAQNIIGVVKNLDQEHRNQKRNTENQLLDHALKLLEGAEGTRTSIQNISSELNIGYEHFRKIFKEELGISPMQYLIDKRINKAKSLLVNKNMSIESIAYELGYPDIYSFSKQFKKKTGMNPTLFRRYIYS